MAYTAPKPVFSVHHPDGITSEFYDSLSVSDPSGQKIIVTKISDWVLMDSDPRIFIAERLYEIADGILGFRREFPKKALHD